MNELIKITESDGKKVVSARELYKFLEATERFSNWIDRQLQYGFEENIDYVGCKLINTLANQELDDYALTINAAKEISMLQRSDKGKQARKYFIECEAKLLEISKPKELTRKELALIVIEQEEKLELLEKKIKKDEVRTQFVDRVIASEDMIDIGQCAKILELSFGRNTLFAKLRENGIFFKNRNEPKQNFIDRGFFKLKEQFIETQNHGTKTVVKVLVTQKGLGFLSTQFEAQPSNKKLINPT